MDIDHARSVQPAPRAGTGVKKSGVSVHEYPTALLKPLLFVNPHKGRVHASRQAREALEQALDKAAAGQGGLRRRRRPPSTQFYPAGELPASSSDLGGRRSTPSVLEGARCPALPTKSGRHRLRLQRPAQPADLAEFVQVALQGDRADGHRRGRFLWLQVFALSTHLSIRRPTMRDPDDHAAGRGAPGHAGPASTRSSTGGANLLQCCQIRRRTTQARPRAWPPTTPADGRRPAYGAAGNADTPGAAASSTSRTCRTPMRDPQGPASAGLCPRALAMPWGFTLAKVSRVADPCRS